MVDPKIYTGDSITGFGADPVRTAYQKYNVHKHWPALFNFLYEPISIGDAVAFYINGTNVLQYQGVTNSATVTGITTGGLQVSTQASISGAGILQVAGYEYSNVQATQGSNLLIIPQAFSGYTTPATKAAAQVKNYAATVTIDTTNPLILNPQSTTDLMAVLNQPPLVTPVQAIPIILSTSKIRLVNLHLLPQWSSSSQNRGVTCRLAVNATNFEYVPPDIVLSGVGRVSTALSYKLINPGAAIYLQLFTPTHLARLSYQLEVINL